MIVSSRSRSFRGERSGVSDLAVLFVIFVLVMVAVVYLVYQAAVQEANAPKASITLSFGTGCSLNFQVTNNDNRILHGWTASVAVSPSDPSVSVSPTTAPVIALAPHGTYSGSFTVTMNGAPPGTYQLKANLLNGTRTISTSNTLSCTLK